MSKLYIFAIGGTGARVLKSLTFLLAAGVKCEATQIIPIIIDPDEANGDVSRTIEILRSYQEIKNLLKFDSSASNRFFKTSIEPVIDSYRITVPNTNEKFKNFIRFNTLSRENKVLVSLLYSQKNLNTNLDVGFKGNPNMGSVVLNQFQNSQGFKDFAGKFEANDRIFIISSIFGGTGAAGFPLLLKNLRSPSDDLSNHAILKGANIGAISVLPYFGVEDDPEKTVDKKTFLSKTKAALGYYRDRVNQHVNTMYYIGDQIKRYYENVEGSVGQKNDSHFIELAAALSILDFVGSDPNENNEVKEFGIRGDVSKITFNDLYDQTKSRIYQPLVQYYLTHLFLENGFKNSIKSRFAADLKITSKEMNGEFFKEWRKFNKSFWQWLEEMDNNERAFSPMTLDESTQDIFNTINGIPLKDSNWQGVDGYERYVAFLNKAVRKRMHKRGKNIPSRFMEINFVATENLIKV